MTTEIEKQFFDTFGIEPYDRYYNCKDNLEGECKLEQTCDVCEKSEDVYCYPQITDRILLELICIAMDITDFGASTVEDLKEVVLKVLISEMKYENPKELRHQVQALFEENNNDR